MKPVAFYYLSGHVHARLLATEELPATLQERCDGEGCENPAHAGKGPVETEFHLLEIWPTPKAPAIFVYIELDPGQKSPLMNPRIPQCFFKADSGADVGERIEHLEIQQKPGCLH